MLKMSVPQLLEPLIDQGRKRVADGGDFRPWGRRERGSGESRRSVDGIQHPGHSCRILPITNENSDSAGGRGP